MPQYHNKHCLRRSRFSLLAVASSTFDKAVQIWYQEVHVTNSQMHGEKEFKVNENGSFFFC